jgi:hypothetical protein
MAEEQPLPPELVPVESSETVRKVITDPSGTIIFVGGSEDRATTAPDGSVSHTRTEIRTSTLDGHVLDCEHGDTAHICPTCGIGPYSRHAMTTCQSCRRYICLACAQQTPAGVLCTTCAKTARRLALVRFFLDIF